MASSTPAAVLVLLEVRYRDTEPATYVIPLTTDEAFDADELAWRRRVMDAMNGSPPDGYEEAVDDYYQRLLR